MARGPAVTVSDRGPGVAAGDRERVFTPVLPPPRRDRGSGAGLGLTLVRQIARRHGGEAQWVGHRGAAEHDPGRAAEG